MPRLPRIDRIGLLHHVMNRALARRTAFESRRDFRAFLALLAFAVRQGRVEVHAYSILPTHFHLLVRSRDGRLSETMRRIENAYVRWFNRTRRRDGPLFRGRFRSFPVESTRYAHVLFRYIDQNPLEARIVSEATAYPYGSAASQSGAGRTTPWVCRTLVDALLGPALDLGAGRASAYARTFAPRLSPALSRFIERRTAGRAREPDALDDLVGAAPPSVHAWMVRKAHLADGTRPGLPMATPEAVVRVVDIHDRRSPGIHVVVGRRSERSLRELALVALLRDVAGETFEAIARRTGMTLTEVWRRYAEHRRVVPSDARYGSRVVDLVREALDEDHAVSTTDAPELARLLVHRAERPSS
jgi:REP element-mobilizing transposase RayT